MKLKTRDAERWGIVCFGWRRTSSVVGALPGQAVAQIVQRCAKRLGLEGAFAVHSLRWGLVIPTLKEPGKSARSDDHGRRAMLGAVLHGCTAHGVSTPPPPAIDMDAVALRRR